MNYKFIYEKGKLECAVLNDKEEIIKTLDFGIEGCYDFTFYAMNFEEETKTLVFEIDENNPLYSPLLNLIEDRQLLIDDDMTNELNSKYILIEKDDDKIYIKFNRADNSFIFDITIINIVFDLRSKVDQQNLNTKSRLLKFFNEINEIFNLQENKVYKKVK